MCRRRVVVGLSPALHLYGVQPERAGRLDLKVVRLAQEQGRERNHDTLPAVPGQRERLDGKFLALAPNDYSALRLASQRQTQDMRLEAPPHGKRGGRHSYGPVALQAQSGRAARAEHIRIGGDLAVVGAPAALQSQGKAR